MRIACIPNAKDLHTSLQRERLVASVKEVTAVGVKIEIIDVVSYAGRPHDLHRRLSAFSGIWVVGGDLFYLRYAMKLSGFDQIIQSLLDQEVVYGGYSAGAIVAGPTLDHFDLNGEVHREPETIWQGLGLTKQVIIPHWNIKAHNHFFTDIKKLLIEDKQQVIPLRDGQAVIIDAASMFLCGKDVSEE